MGQDSGKQARRRKKPHHGGKVGKGREGLRGKEGRRRVPGTRLGSSTSWRGGAHAVGGWVPDSLGVPAAHRGLAY